MRPAQILATTATACFTSSYFNNNLGDSHSTRYSKFRDDPAKEDLPTAASSWRKEATVSETPATAYSTIPPEQDLVPRRPLQDSFVPSSSLWPSCWESHTTSASTRFRSSFGPSSSDPVPELLSRLDDTARGSLRISENVYDNLTSHLAAQKWDGDYQSPAEIDSGKSYSSNSPSNLVLNRLYDGLSACQPVAL